MGTATISKSKRVETFVRNQIAQGFWKPGSRIPDEEVLSAELGVSYMTVKSVMSRLASDGVVDRIQRKGSFVAQQAIASNIVILAQATSLTSSRSNHYRLFLERAIHCIEENGYQPVLRLGYGDTPEKFLSSIQFPKGLASKETVGVISIAGMEEALEGVGIPYVSQLAAPFEGATHGIILDYNAMYSLATEAFKGRGYPDFVIMEMQRPPGEESSPMNIELQRERLRAVDGNPERLLICPFSSDYRFAYDTFYNYWKAGHRPRAIFFADEVLFEIANRAILSLGIRVPEELAILTHGVTGIHYSFPVPVACVEFDAGEIAQKAWDKLHRLILGQPMLEPVYIKPRLREGSSL